MTRFVLDSRGRVVLVDLPAGVRVSHSRNRQRGRFITASLPDGRLVSVLVDVLVMREDRTPLYAIPHHAGLFWKAYLKRDAKRAVARRAEAALLYRSAVAA